VPTALITGVLGQDGSLLAELLLARDYRVVGIDRPDARAPAELRALEGRIELVRLDLETAPVAELVAREEVDEIYHLAACHRSSEPGQADDPAQQQRMVAVNHAAALALAHAALARGARIVFAGSSQMYTPALPAPVITETTPRAPTTFYGVTKATTLEALAWLRTNQGLAASTAILFNHESPRRPASFVSRKITQAAARIAAGKQGELVLGDVSSRTDFSSARDIVEGLHAIASGPPGEYVLASGELCELGKLCEIAFSAVGLDWRELVRSTKPAGERPALVGDPTKARRELGWHCRRELATWIAEMVEADRARVDSE
jgi:GDPmannose 4,6-dehydratase